MLIKEIIKYWNKLKSFVINEKIEQVKPKKKRKVKIGSEEWLHIASDIDRDTYYSKLAENEKIRSNLNKTKEYAKNNNRVLSFDLVPKLQSNRNVRTYLEYITGNYKKWSEIRKNEEIKTGGLCVYCGNGSQELGVNHKTECHEVWEYIYKTKTQKLIRLEPVCIVCHKIKHINQQARNKEEFNNLLELYSIINDITIEQAKEDYNIALQYKNTLDDTRFINLDLSILSIYNIHEEAFNCHSPEFNAFVETFKRKNGNSD